MMENIQESSINCSVGSKRKLNVLQHVRPREYTTTLSQACKDRSFEGNVRNRKGYVSVDKTCQGTHRNSRNTHSIPQQTALNTDAPVTATCIPMDDMERAIQESLKAWQEKNSHLKEFQTRLDERLLLLNLVLRADVPSDGNCFFTSISDQLERCDMPRKTHSQLRAMSVNCLSELKEDDNLYPFATKEYLEDMAKSGTFADECIIRAMARSLGKDIFIVSSSENPEYLWTLIHEPSCRSSGSPLLLGHLGELHYVSLGHRFNPWPLPSTNPDQQNFVSTDTIEKEIHHLIGVPTSQAESCLVEDVPSENCGTEGENEEELDDEEHDVDPLDKEDMEQLGEDEKIYPGHHLPLKISVLIIWLYAITHTISACQFGDLLGLLNLHFLVSNVHFSSFYRFKKHVSSLRNLVKRHFYCNFCMAEVDGTMGTCPNPVCLKDLSMTKSKGYFLELDVINQIRNMFSQPDFVKGIEQQAKRQKKNPSNYEDIYDGNVYKNLSNNGGPLSNHYPYNISFTVNTDGIPIFKSSHVSLWPVYLMINELPYHQRKQQENMVLCGLWFGSNKPFMAYFTTPLHESLKETEQGFIVKVNGQDKLICGFLICLTADLPARAAILNMTQFNGQYSCIKCLQRGQNFRTDAGGNIHVFPFHDESPHGPPRSHETVQGDAMKSCLDQCAVRGIKGPSFLMAISGFDYVKSTSIDYMHCILLGISRLFTKLWFTVSFRNEAFSMYEHLSVVDARLINIKPPNFIIRVPRSLSENLRFWKAAEYRSWLFYYSLPILNDIMDSSYLYHYMCFVKAVFLMCKDSVSESDLQQAEHLLLYFVYMMKSLYGERYLTLNVHSLLHMPGVVRNLGPLWAHSCFAFENANGQLTKFFHGTMCIDLQIANALNVLQTIPQLASSVSKGSNVEVYLNKLTGGHGSTKAKRSGYNLLGAPYCKVLPGHILQLLESCIGEQPTNMVFYKRMSKYHFTYHSVDNSRVRSRNSYTCQYEDSSMTCKFGFIKWFCKVDGSIVCCIEQLNICEQPIMGSVTLNANPCHITKCVQTDALEIVHVCNLVTMCVCVPIENYIYVCTAPNLKETNM